MTRAWRGHSAAWLPPEEYAEYEPVTCGPATVVQDDPRSPLFEYRLSSSLGVADRGPFEDGDLRQLDRREREAAYLASPEGKAKAARIREEAERREAEEAASRAKAEEERRQRLAREEREEQERARQWKMRRELVEQAKMRCLTAARRDVRFPFAAAALEDLRYSLQLRYGPWMSCAVTLQNATDFVFQQPHTFDEQDWRLLFKFVAACAKVGEAADNAIDNPQRRSVLG